MSAEGILGRPGILGKGRASSIANEPPGQKGRSLTNCDRIPQRRLDHPPGTAVLPCPRILVYV